MMSPAPPASFRILPDTGEGRSTTAFAVSIDTRFSSRRIVSPSLTYHSTMVASGRPSPRSGSRNFLDMRGPYECAIARLAAAMILSTLGRYFISRRNSGMWVS